MAIFCCRGKTRAKSGIDGNICGATIQMALKRFHWSQRVDREVLIADRSGFHSVKEANYFM